MNNLAILPRQIIDDPTITLNELRVFTALCSFANIEDKSCYPSLNKIAERCAIKDLVNISRSIKKLVEKGYVEKEARHSKKAGQQSNVYIIRFDLRVEIKEANKKQENEAVPSVDPFVKSTNPPLSNLQTPFVPCYKPPLYPATNPINLSLIHI